MEPFKVTLEDQYDTTAGRLKIEFNVPCMYFAFYKEDFSYLAFDPDGKRKEELRKCNIVHAIDSFCNLIKKELTYAARDLLD